MYRLVLQDALWMKPGLTVPVTIAKQAGNTRDIIWKHYYKDATHELASNAAAKYEAARRLTASTMVQESLTRQLVGQVGGAM